MKKSFFFVILLFLIISISGLSAADKVRIAILDFEVQSANKDYIYLGKGFAEFVAVDLSEYKGIQLIERDKRNAILEEQSFGLSGFADGSKAAELGRLLTAEYMVTGQIFDLLGKLIITLEVIDVESGIVALKTKAEGALVDYNKITKELGTSIVKAFVSKPEEPATLKETPPVKVIQTEQQAKELVVNFSEAIEAYDNNDLEAAEEKMTAAAAIDPEFSAVRYYLNKFAVSTSRFKIMPAPFYSRENPAALPFIKYSSLSLFITTGMVEEIFGEVWPPSDNKSYILDGLYGPGEDTRFGIRDSNERMVFSYQTSLGDSSGINIEAFMNSVRTMSQEEEQVGQNYIPLNILGTNMSLGWSPLPWFALGAGVTLGYSWGEITYQGSQGTTHEQVSQVLYAHEVGFLLKNNNSSFIYSLYGGWTNQIYYLSDIIDQERPTEHSTPLYFDQTITLGFRNNKTFLVSKTIADLSFSDRFPSYIQPIIAVENWFTPKLSFRAGGGYFFSPSENGINGDIGVNLGSTIIISDKWELDISTTYRKRPTTVVEEELIPEIVINLGVVWLNPF